MRNRSVFRKGESRASRSLPDLAARSAASKRYRLVTVFPLGVPAKYCTLQLSPVKYKCSVQFLRFSRVAVSHPRPAPCLARHTGTKTHSPRTPPPGPEVEQIPP